MSQQDFITMIQNKQLENTLKLAKQSTVKIGNKVYTKKSLSAKQWREIVVLNQKMVDAKTELARTDLLIEMREKGALYYFGIPTTVFDENYEKLSTIIEGHILRSNMGATSDIDFGELLSKFENFNKKDDDDHHKLTDDADNNNYNGHSSSKRKKKTAAATTTMMTEQPPTTIKTTK